MTTGRKATLKAIDGGLKGVPPVPPVVASLVEEWNAICADMIARKILTTPALGLLESYLVARWTVREAQKALQAEGVLVKGAHGAPKPNPASGLLARALDTVARLGAELGISPAARSKAQFQPKEGGSDDDAWAGMDL